MQCDGIMVIAILEYLHSQSCNCAVWIRRDLGGGTGLKGGYMYIYVPPHIMMVIKGPVIE